MISVSEEELIWFTADGVYFDLFIAIISSVGLGAVLLATCIAIPTTYANTHGTPRNVTVIFLMLILITSIVYVSRGVAACLILVKTVFWENHQEDTILSQIQIALDLEERLVSSTNWARGAFLIIYDSITIWRAWLLCKDRTLWRVVLAVSFGSIVVINLADFIYDMINPKDEVTTISTLDWVSNVVSLVVNIVTTGFIASIARKHKIFLSQTPIRRKTPAQRTLLLLIESGAFFCIAQLLGAVEGILEVLADANPVIYQESLLSIVVVLGGLSANLAALCIPAVIILVHRGHSITADISLIIAQTMQEQSSNEFNLY